MKQLVRRFFVLVLVMLVLAGEIAVLPSGTSVETQAAGVTYSSPELIEKDYDTGKLNAEQRLVYLLYAIYDYDALPETYQSDVPWFGTGVAREIMQSRSEMQSGKLLVSSHVQSEFDRLLSPSAIDALCTASDGSNYLDTANFRLAFGAIGAGLTINNYGTALETAYSVEVSNYDWGRPPLSANNLFNRYPVQVSSLGGGLYGYVTTGGSYTGLIGDNPNTAAIETQAVASCMVLNSNYSGFPGGALYSLQVTAAHEFVHAIQFGLGDPGGYEDDMFYESMATYAEDEVYDSANDNYLYLPPAYASCLGQYSGDVYSNWLFFRYTAEANGGTNIAGGGEDVIQKFWQNVATGSGALNALNSGLAVKSSSLADTYHKYAITARFMRSCPTSAPYCFEEAAGYVNAAGLPVNNGNIAAIGSSYTGKVQNNYGLRWVGLPTAGPYSVTLQNNSSGQLRGSVVAETASGLLVTGLPALAGPSSSSTLSYFNPPAGVVRVVLVVTNQAQTSANPSSCANDDFTASVGTAGPLPPPPVFTPMAYLPLVIKSVSVPPTPAGPNGKVTYAGSPVAGEMLELRYYNGSSWSSYGTTTTNANGDYQFSNWPSLSGNNKFYVRWVNETNPQRLWRWYCDEVTGSSPSSAYTCDFDVQDVALASPADSAYVSLPRYFNWTKRTTTSDSYSFSLYYQPDQNQAADPVYTTSPLGYIGQYQLSTLPTGFFPNVDYYWEVWVYGSNGFGVSWDYWQIAFSNQGLQPSSSLPERSFAPPVREVYPFMVRGR